MPRRPTVLLITLLAATAALAAAPANAAALSRWNTFTAAHGLAGNIVQALWEDPEGRMWFGTENGVSRYDGRAWVSYDQADGLVDSNVWAISGDSQAVWMATSRGLSRLRGGQWRSYGLSDGLPGEDVRAVLVAADGTVWAGMFGRGIARLPSGAERWEPVPIGTGAGPQGAFVQAIWQSPGGDIWFAVSGAGALRLRGGAFEMFSFRLGNRNTIWSIAAPPGDEGVFLGTFLGLARVGADGQVRVFDDLVDGAPLDSTEILAVAGDSRGDLWLGTRSLGVLHRGDSGWERVTAPGALGRNYIQTILADRAGRVWFGTRGGGVSMLDRRGLDTAELRPAVRAEAALDGAPLDLGGGPLPASANDLRFRFELPLAWLPPDSVTFRYRLTREGSGPGTWAAVRAGPDAPIRAASAPLIDLGPGRYTLEVSAEAAGTAGAAAEQRFTILSSPPALAPPALEADGAPVEAGLSLPQRLFPSDRRVVVRLAGSDDGGAATLRYEYRVGREGAWRRAEGGRAELELPSGVWIVEARAVDADGNTSAAAELRVVVPPPLWTAVLLGVLGVLVPSAASGVAGALVYRRWARRQALLRAVRGYHIPYDVGPLITGPDRYIGRAPVIDTVVGKIAHSSFYIYGEKRIGKTSLLLQVRDRLARRGEVVPGCALLPVFRNIQDVPEQQFWLYLMRSVAGELRAGPDSGLACLGQPPSYDDLDAEEDLARLADLLGRGGGAPLIVLLLDEIDTLDRYDPAVRQRFRAFCQHAQPHMRAIVAGVRPPAAEPGDTSPWYNIFERVALGPLSETEARQLIRSYNQNPYAYAPAAESLILEASALKPFDAQWLCSEAVRAMLGARRTEVQAADAELAVRIVLAARAEEYAAAWRMLGPADRAALRSGRAALDPAVAARLISEGLVAADYDGGHRAVGLWQRWIVAQSEG